MTQRCPMTKSRMISLAIALIYIAVAIIDRGRVSNEVLMVVLAVCFPLALIWFPYAFGNYVGPVRGGYIDTPTPAFLVAGAGWTFLTGIPILMWFVTRPR
jgi:hypothetical protein